MDSKVGLKITDEQYLALMGSSKEEFVQFLTGVQLSGFELGLREGSRGAFLTIEHEIEGIIKTAPEHAACEKDAAMVSGALSALKFTMPIMQEGYNEELVSFVKDLRRDNSQVSEDL